MYGCTNVVARNVKSVREQKTDSGCRGLRLPEYQKYVGAN